MRALTFAAAMCLLVACGGPPSGGGPSNVSARATFADDPPTDNAQIAPATPSQAVSEPSPEGPPDADADGVADANDQCPDTKPGAEVDASGCPIDADEDGVRGSADLCPDSPYGEPVDEHGCRPRLAVAQEFTLLLTFEPNSATIVGDPRAALAEVAALITQYPETTVVIQGHTDDRGAAKYNMQMSQKRADAVAKVLVQDLGIDAARVTAKGFGKTRPIATNATKEGRERNRRVVAVVVPGPAPGKAQQPAATAQTGTRG